MGGGQYQAHNSSGHHKKTFFYAPDAPSKRGGAAGCTRPAKAKSLSHKTNILAPSPPLHPPPPTLKLGFCDRDPRVRRRSLGTKW